MSGSVSKTTLLGYVGKDPELRNSGNGKPIATFSLATSESWKDKNSGERKERTEWHRIVVFNEAICRVIEHYVKKGSRIYLEGKNQTRKWTDQAGVEKYTTEVVLDGFNSVLTLLDPKGTGGPPPAQSSEDYGSQSSRPAKPTGDAPQFDTDDDIPF